MTTYTEDVLPKFRPGDLACMTPKGVRLGDSEWMCDPSASDGFDDHGNARRVFAALSARFMPPDGAWSQEWLDCYQKWMTDGFAP